MINLDAIAFAYTKSNPVFQNFSLSIAPGETWAVLGPSGCGKSTLLYLVAGLKSVASGKISINASPLNRPRPQTGFIIQEYGLLPWATVRQNASLGFSIRSFYGPDGTHAPKADQPSPENVTYWLDRLRLTPHADKFPAQLSGGQRQRTAIARTLALEPDILLMDEPFSSLDAPTREDLQTITLELQREQNFTLLMVTHAIEEAAVLGQKILLLKNPPNQTPNIILNPQAGTPAYRQSDAYHQMCKQLRTELAQEAAR